MYVDDNNNNNDKWTRILLTQGYAVKPGIEYFLHKLRICEHQRIETVNILVK
jgi:hypothetical protein